MAAACSVTTTIMLTFFEAEDDVLAALKAGARGYILKGVSGLELTQQVRAIHAGEVYIPPSLAATVLPRSCSGPGCRWGAGKGAQPA